MEDKVLGYKQFIRKPSARVDAGIPSTQECMWAFPQLQFHKELHNSVLMLLCTVMYV